MYRTVVLPLDGSPFAEQAVPVALSIARQAGARLLLARVRPPEVFEGLVSLYPAGNASAGTSEQAYLRNVRERLPTGTAVPVETVLLEGQVADTLHEEAIRSEADLVVMATHGHGPFSRLWLGSVADELVRRLPMPLLLVRPGEQPADLKQEPVFHRILVPLDGSTRAEKILEPATALGALWGAEYVLTRVIAPVPIAGLDLAGYAPGGLDLAEMERRQQQAHDYLDGVAARLRHRSLRVRTSVLVHRHPAVGIHEVAEAEKAGLIALATRGHGGLKRLLLGSVADKVIRAAPTPVLVWHPLVAE
jgi:nucleotide-binding universal stress UspA family protein